jgi:ureidoacrylate peracid hydrolase
MKTVIGVDVLTIIDELVVPSKTAVLVIDVQNTCFNAIGGFEGAGSNVDADVANMTPIIPKTRRLLEVARAKDILIAYSEFIHRNQLGVTLMDGPNNYCVRNNPSQPDVVEGTGEARTVDELTPQNGDVVVQKSRGSAFHQTPLDNILKARGIGTVPITGVLSAGCVLFTAADAMHHGYYPLVVRDCVASYSLESHRQALAWMGTLFPIFDLAGVLAVWEKNA